MRPPEPVQVLDLFAEDRAALIDLLSHLSEEQWQLPTACSGWKVQDVALHILGGDLTNISRRRDGFRVTEARPGEDLVAFINRINEEWVQVSRRLSPRIIVDLLAFAGPQLFDCFSMLDLPSIAGGISWAGLERAPVWLDVAREYTERWLHQQHIRDATGKPGQTEPRYLAPVLATFVYALPPALAPSNATEGAIVQVHIEGEAGGDWLVVREANGWALYSGSVDEPTARVTMGQSIAWRVFTKGMSPEEAERYVGISGDRELGLHVLRTVSIIA